MTSRLIGFILFPCLILALLLALIGVRQVEFGDTYYNFMRGVINDFNSWSITIPKIPSVPNLSDTYFDSSGLILTVLIKIARAIISFINMLIRVINFVVMLINIAIQLIQFCLTIIYRLVSFRDSFQVAFLGV